MSNRILKNTAIVLACSIAVKVLSFIWEAVLAAYLGVSEQADAFYMVTSICGILYPILDLGIWKVFLPIYKSNMIQDKDTNKNGFANKALSFFLCMSVAFVALLLLFSEPLVWLVAPGFTAEKKTLTAEYLRWVAPTYFLMASSSVIGAMLQCHGRFFGSQVRELAANISKIIFVLLCYQYIGIYAAVLAFVVGSIFRLVLQLPFINWGWHFKLDFNFKDVNVQQMIRRLPSVALTSAISHINGLIDKVVASGAIIGAVSCLNYGHKLMNVFSGMISTAIGTATYPTMVQYIAEKKTEKLRELISQIVGVLSFFIIPISFFCGFFSEELVTIAFQRGAFDSAATSLTSSVFAGYCVGMLFVGVSTIITNIFYGFGDTRITLVISVLDVALNCILNIWFCSMWGVVGLAIATSVSAAVCLLVRFFVMKKYLTLDYKFLCSEFVKITAISFAVVAAMLILLKVIGIVNVYIRVMLGALGCMILFVPLAKVFRISTMTIAISIIKKKIRK